MDCTLQACGPNVVVHVEGLEDAGELSAQLHVAGEDPLEMWCPDNTECVLDVPDIHPSSFSVSIEAGDTTHSRSFTPTYRTHYPNGAECGPRCRQAEVTFTVE